MTGRAHTLGHAHTWGRAHIATFVQSVFVLTTERGIASLSQRVGLVQELERAREGMIPPE